eukprot:sb/3463316/
MPADAVGTIQWYRWLTDISETGASEEDVYKNAVPAHTTELFTVANTNYTALFNITEASSAAYTGYYYVNVSYTESQSFGGGSIVSEIAEVSIIGSTSQGLCIKRYCLTTGDKTCTGEFYDTKEDPTACAYNADFRVQLQILCSEVDKGCAFTSENGNQLEVNVVGMSSSANLTGQSYGDITVTGKKSAMTVNDVLQADSRTPKGNEFILSCDNTGDTADEDNGCTLASIGESYGNEFTCKGGYCTMTYLNGTSDKLTCEDDFCSMEIADKEGVGACQCLIIGKCEQGETTEVCGLSHSSEVAIKGNNNTAMLEFLSKCSVTVAKGAKGATIYLKNGTSTDVITSGENDWSNITLYGAYSSKIEVTGDNSYASVIEGTYNVAKCTGNTCTAHTEGVYNSKNVSGTIFVTTAKVECVGDGCVALCQSSVNCTATCTGKGCIARCENADTCYLTCNGTDCETSCVDSYCPQQLKLPKESKCESCIYAPDMFGFQTCVDDYPSCKNCYLAEWDLLGVTLYRLGCLDGSTETAECTKNEFIKACYLDTCQDDGCSRKLLQAKLTAAGHGVKMTWSVGLIFAVIFVNFVL